MMTRRRNHEFLQLTNTISYPPAHKAKLSIIHSKLIDQVVSVFDGTKKMKEHVIHVFNCISYMIISGDSLPSDWNSNDPLHTYTEYDDYMLESNLSCFIHPRDVDWVDVPIKGQQEIQEALASEATVVSPVREIPKSDPLSITDIGLTETFIPTPKSDLYIQPPSVPRFNTSDPYASGNVDGVPFVVYNSYPEVPTKQNEISATTDVNLMTESDLMKLFPNQFIRTRAECMYEEIDGLHNDAELGIILPIDGYTDKQLRDNVIKYPHIFKLLKNVDGSLESFYSTVEIDGELHKISEVWEDLPESLVIPYTKEFIKEYVVRRYLLERDVKGVEHRYKLHGTLDPFLTLFTTPAEYAKLGYTNAIQLAHSCVIARVNYKRSRNPVLRRLSDV